MSAIDETAHPALLRMRRLRAKRKSDAQALSDQRVEFQTNLAQRATEACRRLNSELVQDRLKLSDVQSDHAKNIFSLTLLSDLGRSLTNSVKYKSLVVHLSIYDEVIVSAGLPGFDHVLAFKDAMAPDAMHDIIVEYIAAAVEDVEA